MTRLHIQLVSHQLAANLIPALMERPDHAALIVTPAMLEQARRLRELQEQNGISVQVFDNAPDADVSRVHEFALDLVERLPKVDEVVLNVTGGTKLMALGFLEMLRDTVDRRIYTDTENGRLEHLPVGTERAEPPVPLDSVLDVPLSLRTQGFRFRSAVSSEAGWLEHATERKRVAKGLADIARDDGAFLGELNRLASIARGEDDELLAPEQALRNPPYGQRKTHLGWLRDTGMIGWSGGREILFLDIERTRFLNGGWLEEYVYHRLRDEGIDDVALGVVGTWDGTDGARNELDVVAVHANRPLVVECKTARHGRDQGIDDHQLYKLNSIGERLRGVFGTTWMISARAPTDDMGRRARQHGIRLLGPQDLPNLRDIVREWKAGLGPGT